MKNYYNLKYKYYKKIYKLHNILACIIFLFISLYNLNNYAQGINNNSKANNTEETILNNGLKIIVKEDHRAPVVISQIWYKVGSSYEPNGLTGLSHMLEHMMFKESKNLKDGEFVEIIAKKGGQQNAFTSSDYTAYYQLLSKQELETSFKLEAERMQNLLIDDEAFQKEQQVVIEERRMRVEDDPISNTYERLMATAYINSPYHNPVIGWPDDLKNYKSQDLLTWYKQWYAPNNATIVVVGDVKPREVFQLAAEYFGKIRPREIPKQKPREQIKPIGEKYLKVEVPAKLPILFMAYNTPSYRKDGNNTDIFALEVINSVLSNSESSRLPKNLERKQEIVTSTSSSYDSFNLYDSLFIINAIPAKDKTIPEIKKAILEQLEDIKNTPVSQEELDRVKANLIANKVYEQDSIYYQAMVIGVLESVNLSWRDYDYYINQLKLVTPEQIQETAKKYFTSDRLTVAELVPRSMDINKEIKNKSD